MGDTASIIEVLIHIIRRIQPASRHESMLQKLTNAYAYCLNIRLTTVHHRSNDLIIVYEQLLPRLFVPELHCHCTFARIDPSFVFSFE